MLLSAIVEDWFVCVALHSFVHGISLREVRLFLIIDFNRSRLPFVGHFVRKSRLTYNLPSFVKDTSLFIEFRILAAQNEPLFMPLLSVSRCEKVDFEIAWSVILGQAVMRTVALL